MASQRVVATGLVVLSSASLLLAPWLLSAHPFAASCLQRKGECSRLPGLLPDLTLLYDPRQCCRSCTGCFPLHEGFTRTKLPTFGVQSRLKLGMQQIAPSMHTSMWQSRSGFSSGLEGTSPFACSPRSAPLCRCHVAGAAAARVQT